MLLFRRKTLEYDYYPESEYASKGSKKKMTPKKVIKLTAIGLVVLVYLVIIVRIFIINSSPKMASGYLWTERSLNAYNADHSSLKVMNQQIRSFTITNPDGSKERITRNDITSDGYYKVSNFMYNVSTGELMITLRMNDPSLEAVRKGFGLEKKPGAGDFVFALETEKGFVTEYSYTYKKNLGYHFFRLVFELPELDQLSEVSLNVYFTGSVVMGAPLGTLVIYDSRIPAEYADTDKFLPAKLNGDLKKSPYYVPKS